METEEQELRNLEKSTAEAHGSLSIGLFATAVFTASRVDGLWWVPLAIIGVLLALSGICLYLSFHYKWRRIKILEIARQVQIKYVAWFLGLAALGISLIRTELDQWVILGLICLPLAYAVLVFGIVRGAKEIRIRGRRAQEVKVEDDTQQPEGYSHEDIYRKLKRIEDKVDSSNRTQKFVFLYALGAAFVILGFSLWPGLLQQLGIDTGRFYSSFSIVCIVLGSITIMSAYIVSRRR